MKKVKKIFCAASIMAVCLFSGPALAANIVWPDSGELRNDGLGNINSLFPNNPSSNSVTVNGDVAGRVYGGLITTGNGDASNNRVVINNGQIGGDVYGGYTVDGSAAGNTITIIGGSLAGDVVGGFTGGGSGATGNTVIIIGSPAFTNTILHGGAGQGDIFTGNTLNVWNYNGGWVEGIINFQHLNFLLSAIPTDALLVVTGDAYLGNGLGQGSIVRVSSNGAAPMNVGDRVDLIRAVQGSGNIIPNGFDQTKAQGTYGGVLLYEWDLDIENIVSEILYAALANVGAAPEARVLPESYIAGIALINQTGDLVAGRAISQAAETAPGDIFIIVSGGKSRYDTSSNFDMSSVSAIAGFSRVMDYEPGRLTLGAFVEYGDGSYDTSSSIGGNVFRGKGDVNHFGGGLLGRMDFNGTSAGRFYAEGSFRGGKSDNDYVNFNLLDGFGRAVSYNSSTSYYALYLGTGYIKNVGSSSQLDLYGKYFWTRLDGDTVRLSSDAVVNFDSVDSHRMRLGFRLSDISNKNVRPYVGAAFEHEFGGDAGARAYGHVLDAAASGGSTGIVELGLNARPSENSNFSMDLGLQGYVGNREGVGGSLRARWEF